jgi:hypothetical protein
MILDRVIALADELGVPHYDVITCTTSASRAGRILARVETLLMIDPEGTLGDRLRFAKAKVTQ